MHCVEPNSSRSRLGGSRRTRDLSPRGFTLTEVLVATAILGMAVSMTMVVFIAAVKRARHTDDALQGTAQLRHATDVISQAVRSSADLPQIKNSGLQLLVAPKDQASLVVQETTFIDAAKTVKGTKSNQKNMKVDPVLTTAPYWIFAGTARPTDSITGADISKYFITSAPSTKVSDILSTNDTVSIPQTSFGSAMVLTVNSVSNNSGTATITFTTNVTQNVPCDTPVTIKSGRAILFEVIATKGATQGDLRMYPDSRDLTEFVVLAHNIDPAPLTDPTDLSSAKTVPFAIPTSETHRVVLNFQVRPPGTLAGRTVQGTRTTVFTRNEPSIK